MATHVVAPDPEPLPLPSGGAESAYRVAGTVLASILLLVALGVLAMGLRDDGILSAIVFIPLIGAFSMALLHPDDVRLHRGLAVTYTILVAIPILMMAFGGGGVTKYADPYLGSAGIIAAGLDKVPPDTKPADFAKNAPNNQWMYEQKLPWWRITNPPAPAPGEQYHTVLDASYHVGLDGWSFPMVLLTGIIFVIAALASFGIEKRTREYFAWFLILETAVLGTFCSLNYILFYIFWEMMLVPMYFLIAIWGGPRREYAAIKMFLYTLFGSIFLLLGLLYLYYNSGGNTFEFADVQRAVLLKHATLNPAHLKLVWLAIFLGFAIKVPVFPFHTWLPDAHVEAPTPISVILAAILLKMGTYGFFRVLLPTMPEETRYFTPLLAILGVIGIVYGALVAMAQDDLKKLVAYSSVGHMGFCILGFAAGNELGIGGANFMVLGHGIISAAMFLLVGVIYDRAHTRQIDAFGGLMEYMRLFTIIAYFASFANLGLPGLVGFWGEFYTLIGAFQAHYQSGAYNLMRVCACIAVLGMLTTAGYMLWMVQRVFLGKPNPRWAQLPDVSVREQITLWPLVVGMVFFGIMPGIMTGSFNGSLTVLTNWLVNWQAMIPHMTG
ncbi:MAG: NADH-quinone oxidoreductase subunit M [bacterium]